VGKIVVVMVLLAAGGYGVYHFILRFKPAFDIDRLEDMLSTLEEKKAVLGMVAGDGELPGWIQMQVDYFDEMNDILSLHVDDCAATVDKIRSAQNRFHQQAGGLDRRAILQRITQAPRAEQQKLGAQYANAVFNALQRLLPALKDFSYECPEESAIFNVALQ